MLVRGDTTLAELHHIFQVVMGWENWHLHSFHLWGKDYGLSYAGGTWYADDSRRVHLGDDTWRVNDKSTYPYDFGDYWQHQVRVEKLLPPTAMPATPVCVSGRWACPPEEVGGPAATTSARWTNLAGVMNPSTACWPARTSGRTTCRPGSGPTNRSACSPCSTRRCSNSASDDGWLGEELVGLRTWPGLRAVIAVETIRQVQHQPGTHVEWRYYLTSCPDAPAVLIQAIRRHRTIENSLHWVLDVVFREDEARSRDRVATRNFAVLRELAFNLLQQGKYQPGSLRVR